MKRICVQCGSNAGFEPAYRAMARRLGQTLAEQGLELVYGGSHIGLMGEVANAALAAGGRAIGVIPKALASKVAHAGLSELYVVDSMHQRKAQMFELSDGFLALPGGWGTLEEMAEVLTWAQLGWHQKPCGLLNVDGYYDPLLAFLDQAVTKGFLHPAHRSMLLVAESPETLLEQFAGYQAPAVQKWGLVPD